MDDQGAGGSSRANDTNRKALPVRQSSLPPALIPLLITEGKDPPPMHPNWSNPLVRSRSQGGSLPPPSQLFAEQTELPRNPDHTVLSRSVDASPVNPASWTNQDLPPARFLPTPLPPVNDPLQPTMNHPIMGGHSYPPMTRSMSTSPFESHSRSYTHAPPYTRYPTSRTPQPPQPHLASSSQSQTLPSFSSELYSEGQPEIKPFHQGGSMGEPPVIEMQGAVPERKKAQKSPVVKKEPGTPTEEGGSTSASTGVTTSTRRKPSTKVTVACDFCRGRKLRCDGERPCSNCSGRGTECTYQPGGPRRRGPGKAPKKTRAESSRQRQQQQQQQQAQQQTPDQSQMSISTGSPVSSGPSPITIVPTTGMFGGGSPLTPGGMVTTGPRFPSQSPGASTSEMETGSQSGSRRRLSGSSVDDPERKRSRIRELEGEGRH